jgi:glycosyltransferase involved in cell wall biosynthesis
MKTTINMMVRDEPFSPLGLLSLIDYVDDVLIYDTGSTDGTYEKLQSIQNKYHGKVILNKVEIPNAQGWEYREGKGVTKSVPDESKTALGDLWRQMHAESTGDFIWLLDGDEIYYDNLASGLAELISKNLRNDNYIAVFPPFVDLTSDGKHVRLKHDMGRIFRKNATRINGEFLAEMHYSLRTNSCINNWDSHSIKIEINGYIPSVLHFESVVKPWRKEQYNIGKFNFKLPEVFYKYKEFVPFDKYEFLKEFYE